MFNNASNIDASHSAFSEVHRDQYIYSTTRVQGNQSINTIVHGNQVFQSSFGLENLYRAHVPSAAFDSVDRHPAPSCLPGTRLELLARLTDWVDNPSRDHPICWLSGPAGSGKSAIAQSLAEKYASLHRIAASFFFSRKEISRRKAQGLFPTLACQMLVFAPSTKPALLDALDVDATIPTKVLTEQARRLLQEPIASSMCSFPDPVLIIVDSLDECDDTKMAKEIVSLLAGILRHCHWPLKVLITSRAELHIVQTFQELELQDMSQTLRLQDFKVDDDIRAYLRRSFVSLWESTNAISTTMYSLPSPWPSEDELEMIVENAAGLFIFATTVVKYVGMDYGSPVARLQAALQALRNSASAESALVHSPLDTLYSDALRAIPDLEKVRLVFGMVVFSFEPLSTRGLNDLIWTNRFDASYVVRNLSSVLTISGSDIEGDGAIRFYHTSFRDFLTTPHRSGQYFVGPAVFHSILGRACLELMIRHLTEDMLNLGDPSTLNCEIEDLDESCKLHIKEGVRYACRWFAHHISQVPLDQVDNALLLCVQGFARRCLLNWIEVLSLTGALDSAILSLREVAEWLKRSAKPHDETLILLLDAERLVLMCYDSVERSALQVYYSLPCLPTCVQIRKTYANELKNKFMIHGLDDHWKLCLRSVSTNVAIKSLAISTSGRLIATAGDTPGVQLWDTLSGTSTGHFCGNGASTCPVMFSWSGDYVAIGYDTGTVDVWDVATGQQVLGPTQNPHNASVTTLAFPRHSLLVASGAGDATVHIWDIPTKTLKHSLVYHKGPVSCLSFSSNDDMIASGSDDKSIVTSDVHSGRLLRTFQGHTSAINTISFSPESESIASGSDDQCIRVWDTRTGVCLRTFAGMHKKPVRHVWITADNKYVVSVCSMDIYLWEINSPNRKSAQHLWSVNRYYRKLATIFPAWYAKLARIVPAGLFGQMAELDDGTPLHTTPSPRGTPIACAYGSSLLLLDYSTSQRSWSKIRHPLASPPTIDDPPLFAEDSGDDFTAVVMTPDSTLLVTSSDSGTIKIWNTTPKNSWRNLQGAFKRTFEGFWPAPDGRSLLAKPLIGLQLIASTGAFIKDLETGGDTLGTVGAVPSPDSQYFAFWAEYTWNVDKSFSIHIYNATTGVRIKRIPGFFNITSGRFSAESDLFACAHGEGVVQVWELPSAVCKTTVNTGHSSITALEFLPGSVTLVVGSDAGCVEIRLVENGDVVHRVTCAPSKVLALAVPREALIVIVGHEDGSLFVWDPSYTTVGPHCLSPKTFSAKETSNDAADNRPDGVDFIKFTEGYRSVCTRSIKGVICTWNLTHCLAEYAAGERAKVTSVDLQSVSESLDDEDTALSTHLQPSDIPSLDLSDQSALAGVPTPEQIPLPAERDESESSNFHASLDAGTVIAPALLAALDTPNTSDTAYMTSSRPLSCPHLVSRSDVHIVYDRYFRSTYAVDGREGWVYRGSRRMFWLPHDLRPASPTALAAFEDRLIILTRSRPIVSIDLTPMVKPSTAVELELETGGMR